LFQFHFCSLAMGNTILSVQPNGKVEDFALEAYIILRRCEIANRLSSVFNNPVVKQWFDEFSEEALRSADGKFLGNASGEQQALASIRRAKATEDIVEVVAAVEEFIIFFCGFNTSNVKCLVNAVHFQYEVNRERLLSATLTAPTAGKAPSQEEKDLFDASEVSGAELLLRSVVEMADGSLFASPFSPGAAMGLLLQLPQFAQVIMALTNTVEAIWLQQDIPECPMSINVYASLLVDGAPVQEMVHGVRVVEVMEMTKGAKRGQEVDTWVDDLRKEGIEVLLDDFDSNHPGRGSSPDGVKVCVFTNAFHSLQAFNEGGAPATMPAIQKAQINNMDFKDYYCALPETQPHITKLVMEGSENCLKSVVTPGPPLTFDEPAGPVASAHVYQAAAKALPNVRILHQGGRALYDDEDFDEEAISVITGLKKPMAAARKGDAGTMAWIGSEAKRRAAMKTRPLTCGVIKKTF